MQYFLGKKKEHDKPFSSKTPKEKIPTVKKTKEKPIEKPKKVKSTTSGSSDNKNDTVDSHSPKSLNKTSNDKKTSN